MNFLNGKKSYIAAAAMLIFAVVIQGWQNGDWQGAIKSALESLSVFGIRLAIANK
jgi:hypothetical protein